MTNTDEMLYNGYRYKVCKYLPRTYLVPPAKFLRCVASEVPRTRATQNTADKILRDMIEKFVVTSYAWRYLQVVHAANLPGYY